MSLFRTSLPRDAVNPITCALSVTSLSMHLLPCSGWGGGLRRICLSGSAPARRGNKISTIMISYHSPMMGSQPRHHSARTIRSQPICDDFCRRYDNFCTPSHQNYVHMIRILVEFPHSNLDFDDEQNPFILG